VLGLKWITPVVVHSIVLFIFDLIASSILISSSPGFADFGGARHSSIAGNVRDSTRCTEFRMDCEALSISVSAKRQGDLIEMIHESDRSRNQRLLS